MFSSFFYLYFDLIFYILLYGIFWIFYVNSISIILFTYLGWKENSMQTIPLENKIDRYRFYIFRRKINRDMIEKINCINIFTRDLSLVHIIYFASSYIITALLINILKLKLWAGIWVNTKTFTPVKRQEICFSSPYWATNCFINDARMSDMSVY